MHKKTRKLAILMLVEDSDGSQCWVTIPVNSGACLDQTAGSGLWGTKELEDEFVPVPIPTKPFNQR